MIPSDDELMGLAEIDGYIMPDDSDDVFWFMQTTIEGGIEFKWVEHRDIPMYFKDYRFMGMSVKRKYPHFYHKEIGSEYRKKDNG